MNIIKRTVAALLALLTLIPLAACSNNPSTPDDTTKAAGTETVTSAPDDTSELTPLQQRQAIPDDLPAKDFGGAPFRICTDTSKQYEVWTEELTGTNTNDAVFNRNKRIEERFNVTIESIITDAPYNDVKTQVLAGSDAYELVSFVDFLTYVPVGAKALYNWLDVPYIDVTKPWYNQLANGGATINGKLFAINSDLSISSLLYTYGMFVNYRIAEEYGYDADTLYQLVFNGEWTLDKFYEITQKIYNDNNGNSKKDIADTYGYACNLGGQHTPDVWLAALDIDVTKTVNDTIEVHFMNEKTVSALEKVVKLIYNNDGAFQINDDWRKVPATFASGTIAFTQLYFGETTESLGDMQDTYGILPMPKWDKAQEGYYTNAWDQFTNFAIPKTANNFEMIGCVFEALSAETYKTVYPEYYDIALKSRYSADETVAEIVDIIMAGRKFEFSFQFGEQLQRLPYLFRDMLCQNNTDIASKYSKIEKVINKTIDKVIGYYEDED